MIEGLQEDSQRKDDRTEKKAKSEQKFDRLREVHATEAYAKHNQENGKTDPMAVDIHLAVVVVFRFLVLIEAGLEVGGMARSGSTKAGGQG
jgi:hypothetical protein